MIKTSETLDPEEIPYSKDLNESNLSTSNEQLSLPLL